MTEQEGFLYRTRLAWTRTAATFIAAGLLVARLQVIGGAASGVWLTVELLLVLMSVTSIAGYSVRRSAEAAAGSLLLVQSVGMVAVALLAAAGMLVS